MTEPQFPVDSFKEAAPHLRRPFTVAAVRFRVLDGKDTGDKARARCAAYIDARLAIERLNLVCPHLWTHAFEPVHGGLRCDLTVDGMTRPDVGWSRGTGTDMDLKALYSDAFKRAAVHFGVGVSLYALPGLTIYAKAGHVRVWERQGKQPGYYLTDAGERELRKRYRAWLEEKGTRAFGEPLDHGDVEHEPEGEPAPVERDVQRTEASDVPAEDPWFAEVKPLLKGVPSTGLKAAVVAAGGTVPEHVSSWQRVICALDAEGREAFVKALGELAGDPWTDPKVAA